MNLVSPISCYAGMKKLRDKSFHFSPSDPPYGIGESGKNHKSRNTLVRQSDGVTMRRCPSTNYKRSNWDESIPGDDYFYHLKRICVNYALFGANYFPQIVGTAYKPPRRNDFEYFIKHNPKGWIVWDKVNGTSDFSDCELIYTTFDFDSYIFPYMWAGMMQGKSIAEGTVMQGNKTLNEKRIRPTQKPVIIYRYLYQKFATAGMKVFDSHVGSGSSRIAADVQGLDFFGYENDIDMWKKQELRYHKYKSQLQLSL